MSAWLPWKLLLYWAFLFAGVVGPTYYERAVQAGREYARSPGRPAGTADTIADELTGRSGGR
jgi:hypothetical protein